MGERRGVGDEYVWSGAVMPSVHIPEGPFDVLVDRHGYQGAKDRVKELVREDARGGTTND